MDKLNSIVLIGRFQPFHNAHAQILQRASQLADQIIVVIGSANQPRTYKNPWTAADRHDMIRSYASKNIKCKVVIEQVQDSMYDDLAWAVRVQNIVKQHTASGDKVGIIGHNKDESTYYLNMFPQWERVEVDLIEPLNATDIRALYFKENPNINFFRSVVPDVVVGWLDAFKNTEWFDQIVRERQFIETYKKQFEGLSYAPIFVTTDAVVIQGGHVLLIKRRSEPGKGLWALPGGFVNALSDKSVEDAMIRELREETGIKVPEKVLRGSIKEAKVFDAINRSARGRTITHAFFIPLIDGEWNLPKVKGADDAEKAEWVPLSNVRSEELFDDHFQILQYFLGGM